MLNQPKIALHGIIDLFKSNAAGFKHPADKFHPPKHPEPCAFPHADPLRRNLRPYKSNRKMRRPDAGLFV